MKTDYTKILIAALILLLHLATGTYAGNNRGKGKIKILHADMAIPGRDTLPTKLLGNVKLKHNDIIMSCDSLYQYEQINFVEAFSRVHMVQNDTLNLWGDLATYDGNSQMAKVRTNVKLQDPQITLTTDFLDYDAGNEIGHYFNHGHIKDSTNTLDSELGYYYIPLNTLFFRNDVKVRAPQYLMISDTMKYHTVSKVVSILGPTTIYGTGRKKLYSEDGWYNTLTSHAELYKNNRMNFISYDAVADTLIADSTENKIYMHRNISIQDTAKGVTITGHYGEVMKNDSMAFVTDSAVLTLIGSPQDTIFLHSDTLHVVETVVEDSTTQIFNAYKNVRFFHKNLQGRCDSMSLTTMKDTIIHLYRDPVVWTTGNQLTAESIDLYMKNGQTDKFIMEENSLIINDLDTNIVTKLDSNMYNQIRGRTITGYFKDNDIYKIKVYGSGESLYYPDDKGTPFALTHVNSSEIYIYVNKRKIESINFVNRPNGEMTPLFLVKPNKQFLTGFAWRETERPISKDDIFRTVSEPAAEENPYGRPSSQTLVEKALEQMGDSTLLQAEPLMENAVSASPSMQENTSAAVTEKRVKTPSAETDSKMAADQDTKKKSSDKISGKKRAEKQPEEKLSEDRLKKKRKK